MSETCPKCGANGRCDTYQVGERYLQGWLCGSEEHINGRIMRSAKCFEAQLAQRNSEIERLRNNEGYYDEHDSADDSDERLRAALRRIRSRVREMNNTLASREWAYDELLALIAFFPKEKE